MAASSSALMATEVITIHNLKSLLRHGLLRRMLAFCKHPKPLMNLHLQHQVRLENLMLRLQKVQAQQHRLGHRHRSVAQDDFLQRLDVMALSQLNPNSDYDT